MIKLPMLSKFFIIISIFLVFPLVTMSFLFNYNVIKYSENEISRFATINLKNIKQMNELIIDSTNKDMARLSLSSYLENLTEIPSFNVLKGDTEKILKVNLAVNQLKDIVYSNYRIQSIDVYIKNGDFIISSTGSIVPAKDFEDYEWIKTYLNQEDAQRNAPSWIARKRISGTDAINTKEQTNVRRQFESDVISFIYPLSSQPTKIDGIIIMNFYEKQFSDLLNSSNLGEGEYFYIINDQGNVFSHVDKSLIGKNIKDEPIISSILKKNDTNGYVFHTENGKKRIVTYYKSGNNNWIYLGVYSLDNLLQKATSLRYNLLIIVLLFIIIGVALSYFTSRKLYSPLQNLINDIKTRKGIDITGSENEMALLSKAFNSLSKQEDILNKRLESNRHSLEEKFLLSLLKGEETQSMDNVEFDSSATEDLNYICAVCTIDKYRLFTNKFSKEDQYYYKMLLIQLCEQVFGELNVCKGLILDKNRIVVVIAGEEINITSIKDGYKKIHDELMKAFDISVSVGLSPILKGKTNLKECFSRAENACKRRMIEGYGSIIRSDNYNEESRVYFYPYEIEKRILNQLSVGSYEEMEQELEVLLRSIKNRENLSCDNILQLFNQLVGNTIKYLVENNINISDLYSDNFNIYMALADKETLDDIILLLKDFYKRIIDNYGKHGIDDKQYIDRILEYIRQNFTKELDIEDMVKSTGISYSYIRKIIKNDTGKSVVDHINELRIEEAKKLLRQTNMKISEIAINIGYNNDQSFARFFKKIEGITPGEFRNINKL